MGLMIDVHVGEEPQHLGDLVIAQAARLELYNPGARYIADDVGEAFIPRLAGDENGELQAVAPVILVSDRGLEDLPDLRAEAKAGAEGQAEPVKAGSVRA